MKKIIRTFIIVLVILLGTIWALVNFNVDEKLGDLFNKIFGTSTSASDSSEHSSDSHDHSSDSSADSSDKPADITTDTLAIRFLEVGNQYTGDCTLIQIGDTEVLIDAGSRKGSAETIVPAIREYCTDGVLEYVIATHAHQDHIAGFVGTSKAPGIFDSFECKTIIDFSLTNATSSIYKDYISKRDAEVEAGATHYTALQCWNNADGAKRSYTLADGVTMNVLYNTYYEVETSDENDYSVCLLFSQGSNHYLFTGDLEEKGEAELVKNNTLPKVKLFKAGHHGSYTANTDALLSVIQPEIVCVCCCCGSDEYTDNVDNMFPSQAFVNNVARYTDRIYVTTIVTETGFASLNGTITVYSDGGAVNVSCSASSDVFKDTDWFKKNRTWPAYGV